MNQSVYVHQHTRREFRERMASAELQACIIPVAAIEQHLEHMAMEHDWRSVNVIAEHVAVRLSPRVVIAQGVMAGISEHHMKHAGTLSLRPSTFLAVLSDLIDSVVRAGFHNVLVLNGHGGNIVPCQAVWDQLLRQFQINLHFLPYWDVLDDADASVLVTGDLPGHAQEFETAFALAAFAENVRLAPMQEQADQSPTHATASVGQQLIDRVVDRVADYLQAMIDGDRTVEIPPFFE